MCWLAPDTLTFEKRPPVVFTPVFQVFPVHMLLIADHGIFIIENFRLEGLAAAGVYEFLLVVPPIKIRGGKGSAGADAGARSPGRWTWARLLRRVFAIQVLVCERCGGPRRVLGAVTEPHAVGRLLAALGLAAQPPPGHAVPAA